MKNYLIWLKIKIFIVFCIEVWLMIDINIPSFISQTAYIVILGSVLLLNIVKLALLIKEKKAGYILTISTSAVFCLFVCIWSIFAFFMAIYKPILFFLIFAIDCATITYNAYIIYHLKQNIKHN